LQPGFNYKNPCSEEII
jgi:erythrocyte band 7 integral membrane protein